MPKLVFTKRELSDYFSGYTKSSLKKDAEKAEKDMRVHAEGHFPKEIIEQTRPHESIEVFEYRKKIWQPKTKPTFNKVFNSLSKIRRSADWAISYPDEQPTRIPEEETLQSYCEEYFPYFGSVTNWAFQVLLREYLIDPNAVCLVLPLELPTDPSEFIKPYPIVFNSCYVVDFRHDDYAILENKLGSSYTDANGGRYEGKSFYVVTTQEIIRYDQISGRGDYAIGFYYEHAFGTLPAYKLQAVLVKTSENDFLYESRIAGMLPELNEAVREYSDLQAAKVMHIYPERWEYVSNDCKECNGTGLVPNPAGAGNLPIVCGKCKGVGYIGSSPYSKLTLKLGGLDQAGAPSTIPVPPAGFVEKDVEIVKLQEDGIDKHIYQALASVNMEFLAEKPLAQSGVAKEVDRDETNNFVHSVAEDIVRIVDWVYYIIAKYRYSVQYTDDEQIDTLLPDIEVPEHFDIFSTRFIEEELKNAKENKINPVLINAMEAAYARKKFIAEDDIASTLALVLVLDPMANITEEDKSLRLQNNGITEVDYVISCNIHQFVIRAMSENDNFARLTFEEQQTILQEYAQEVVDENSANQQVLNSVLPPTNGQPQPNNGAPQPQPMNNNNGGQAN